jgi:hypothetical protein
MSRRLFLAVMFAALCFAASGTAVADDSPEAKAGAVTAARRPTPPVGLVEARQKAAQRRRRIIYNNDGDDIWAKDADTVDKFLAVRHEPLVGTQVDSIFYCTTQSFNLFTHDTRVAEVFLSREGSFADNHLQAFLDRKTDPLRMSCAFARRHGLEVIWTLRMNDIHDAWTPQFVSQWKKADARRIMSSLEKAKSYNDRRRLWSLVDFEHPDVEPRLLAIVEEVLRNFPVDGVELDFLRAPFYFRTAYEGMPVTDKQAGILTRLVRNARKLVLRESERQGKPFLLTVRVPATAGLCRRIGVDIEAWLKAKLIDVLALGGGYVAFDQPVAALIELGHKYAVPVYPCLSQSGLMYRAPRGKGEPQPRAAWNGAALRFWEAGADGIYVFNLFPGPGPQTQHDDAVAILKTIGSKETLLKADRCFAVSDAGWSMPAHYWANDAEEFSRALPVALSSKSATTVPLIVPGPIAIDKSDLQTELRIDFTGLTESAPPRIGFNKQRLGRPQRTEVVAGVRRFHFNLPVGAATTGRNDIRVEALSDTAKLAGAELWIRKR